ncbi:MAG: hypothetical protein PVJ98_00240 [Akkermansiaceae bacterium]|jgi:microcystin-dependent protein
MHKGTGAGLSTRSLGAKSGAEKHTLTALEMPSHTHTNIVSTSPGNQSTPVGGVPSVAKGGDSIYSSSPKGRVPSGVTGGAVGGSQPHNNMPPYLVLNFSIALTGIYPSRS